MLHHCSGGNIFLSKNRVIFPDNKAAALRNPAVTDGTFIIQLNQGGFYPPRLAIRKGQKVEFITTRGKPFWPASNPHPSHERYAAFDPKRPLEPNARWAFAFNKTGEWQYHDHLNPSYAGVIVVQDDAASSAAAVRATPSGIFGCGRNESPTEKEQAKLIQCWNDFLRLGAVEKGIDRALDVFLKEFQQNSFFRLHCHKYLHTIGLQAYWQETKGDGFSPTSATTLCGYGFYHSFMQEFVSHGRDIKKAAKRCDEFDGALHKKGELAERCYHSIGHGLAYLWAENFWGDEAPLRLLVKKALADCDMVIPTRYRYDCRFGVFGGIESFYYGEHGYRLDVNRDDPFWLCHDQEPAIKKICYDAFVPFVYNALGSNLTLAALTNVQDEFSHQALKHFGLIMYKYRRSVNPDVDGEIISLCRSLRYSLRTACLEGYSSGFVESSLPEAPTESAYRFCDENQFSADERRACFFGAIEMAVYRADRQKAAAICDNTPIPYQSLCAERLEAIHGEN